MPKTEKQIEAENRGRAARIAGQLPDLDGNPYRDDDTPEKLAWHWHNGWYQEAADIADRRNARL